MQRIKEALTPGRDRNTEYTETPAVTDPSFDAAARPGYNTTPGAQTGYGTDTYGTGNTGYGTGNTAGYGTGNTAGYGTGNTAGYGTTDTAYGATDRAHKPGIGERIKAAIPGTEEHREKKMLQNEMGGTAGATGLAGTGMVGTGAGLTGTARDGSISSSSASSISDADGMRVRRGAPDVNVERFDAGNGMQGEVVTRTQQTVLVPEGGQRDVVCNTQRFTEVEDRPVVVERVVREVVHRPVEKHFEVVTRAVGEKPLTERLETLDVNERVVDQVEGQRCPNSTVRVETIPMPGAGESYGSAGYPGERFDSTPGRTTIGERIKAAIPGTAENKEKKHLQGELTTGERMEQRMNAPAGYDQTYNTTRV